MKHTLILLIACCLLPLYSCSKDETDTLTFDELKIELNSDGFIVSPLWMKQLVDDSKFELPDGRTTPGILHFTGVQVDGIPYIETGITYSSYSCTAFQVYRLNGEKLECFSPEYEKVMSANTEKDSRILWTAP